VAFARGFATARESEQQRPAEGDLRPGLPEFYVLPLSFLPFLFLSSLSFPPPLLFPISSRLPQPADERLPEFVLPPFVLPPPSTRLTAPAPVLPPPCLPFLLSSSFFHSPPAPFLPPPGRNERLCYGSFPPVFSLFPLFLPPSPVPSPPCCCTLLSFSSFSPPPPPPPPLSLLPFLRRPRSIRPTSNCIATKRHSASRASSAARTHAARTARRRGDAKSTSPAATMPAMLARGHPVERTKPQRRTQATATGSRKDGSRHRVIAPAGQASFRQAPR